MHVYIAPESGNPVLFWGAVQYYYRWLRPVSIQHIAIASRQVLIFMDEWTSHHMTTLQLAELRTRNP